MSATAPHRIRTQRLHVAVGAPAEAHLARARLRARWEQIVLPALERAFDELAPGDTVVRLDRLAVKLRLPSLDQRDEDLCQQVYEALREALIAAMPTIDRATPTETADAPLWRWLTTGATDWALAAPELDGRAALTAHAKQALPGLAAQIRSGALDAVSLFRLLALLEIADLRPLLLMLDVSSVTTVTPVFSSDDSKIEKIDVSLNTTDILESWEATDATAPRATLLRDGLLTETAPLPRYGRLRLSALLLADAARTLAELCAQLATLPPLVWGEPLAPVLRWLAPILGGLRSVQRAWPWLPPDRLAALAGIAVEELTLHGCTTATAPATTAPSPPPRPAPTTAPDTPLPVARMGADPAAEARPCVVPMAGLVLLHPYLPRFFEHSGLLLPATRQLDPQQLPRAAALLIALATGVDEPTELGAELIKVLLGLDPEAPLPLAGGLVTEADREEMDSLLGAVIAHWGALGQSSPMGLRGSFLCRNGLLRRDEQGWQLQVQPATWDILLGRLPWALSVVRLPWMPAPLYVQWEGP